MNSQMNRWIADLSQKKAEKKIKDAEVSNLEADIKTLEGKIIDALESAELTETGSDIARVSIRESVIPSIKDRDAFLTSLAQECVDIVNNQRPLHEITHLFGTFEFRPSVTRYREELALGKQRPGAEPFTKKKIALHNK